MRRVLTTVSLTAIALALGAQAHAASVDNPICLGEAVPFNPGHGEDIFVPPGYKIEAIATGLNFPSNIAFRTRGGGDFEMYVTESGDSLPGRCNSEDRFEQAFPNSAATNPFLADIRVLNSQGQTLRVIGKATSVANKGDPAFLHAPTIGVAFEKGFDGRMIVTDSRQGIRGAQGPRNSSRVLQVDPLSGAVKQLVIGLPTGDHPTEQVTVHDGFIYWSQGSATNSGVVGHDNGAAVGGGPDLTIQHEIPCQDVVLSGNNSDSGDGHITGGYLAHGIPGTAGQIVPAFDGATQKGMCTGAILRARLDNPQATVEPYSWGYRNPFGIRFAPEDHVLKGALLVSENGEDERGARPTNNSPDRIHVTRGGLDYHGWPDRFGFLDSSQALYNPQGGPGDDNLSPTVIGKPVKPLLQAPPQQPIAPISIEPSDVALVGHDFAPNGFAGAGNPGDTVEEGDSLVTREGDFGFSPPNGDPNIGHDIEKVHFLPDGRIKTERFIFNCTKQVTDPFTGVARCTAPAGEAFAHGLRGINRPVDGKFGPDGAFYLVDFGAVRDQGRADPATKWLNAADAPLVQIPGTGVIWKISRVGPVKTADRDKH